MRSGSIQLREFDSDDDTEMDQPYIQRQPDDQFQHDEAEYPGVVYEVACSQDSRGLRKAAWTYIPYSNANIKAVGVRVGIREEQGSPNIVVAAALFGGRGRSRNFGC